MPSNNLLGEFLRARRARVHPSDVGLPPGDRGRRTPGLRREELAALAGVSIDYLTRLEQGKETNPGPSVLDALARWLLLDPEERDHFYKLSHLAAQRAAGAQAPGVAAMRPGVRQILDIVRPYPAYVLNRVSDILAANPEAITLFAGIGDWPEQRRNTTRYHFVHPAARDLFVDWPAAAASAVANLRTIVARDPQAPDLATLVDELSAESAEFAHLWQRYDVRRRRGQKMTFRHPQVGELTLSFEVLNIDDTQRMTIYLAPPGTVDHDALMSLSITAGAPPKCPPRCRDKGE